MDKFVVKRPQVEVINYRSSENTSSSGSILAIVAVGPLFSVKMKPGHRFCQSTNLLRLHLTLLVTSCTAEIKKLLQFEKTENISAVNSHTKKTEPRSTTSLPPWTVSVYWPWSNLQLVYSEEWYQTSNIYCISLKVKTDRWQTNNACRTLCLHKS